MSVGVAIIVVGVVALFLGQFLPATYQTATAGVIWNGSAGNTTLTVQGGLGGVTVYNDSSQGLTLAEGEHYTLTAGLLYVFSNATSTNMANYTYSAYTNATSVISSGQTAMRTFADWFVVIIIVVVSVIILSLVMLLKHLGGGKE